MYHRTNKGNQLFENGISHCPKMYQRDNFTVHQQKHTSQSWSVNATVTRPHKVLYEKNMWFMPKNIPCKMLKEFHHYVCFQKWITYYVLNAVSTEISLLQFTPALPHWNVSGLTEQCVLENINHMLKYKYYTKDRISGTDLLRERVRGRYT
jgi:hypothetical protein